MKFAHADVLHILCICARWEIGVTFGIGGVAAVDAAAGHVNTASAFKMSCTPCTFLVKHTLKLEYFLIQRLENYLNLTMHLLRPYSVTKQHIRH